MSTAAAPEPEELEPSPFSEDDEPDGPVSRPWKPAVPLTQADLDAYMARPIELRTYNPWQCMWNLMAEDGIGYYSGVSSLRCPVTLADPTKARYCLQHATAMGVDYYAPPELAEATAKETATNLTRLVPKATKVLEDVMDDDEAPQGVRAKAAAEILDRTGYVRGVDVRVDAQIATVDVSAVIADRLNALREAHMATIPGVVVAVTDETDADSTGVHEADGGIIDGNHDDDHDHDAEPPTSA